MLSSGAGVCYRAMAIFSSSFTEGANRSRSGRRTCEHRLLVLLDVKRTGCELFMPLS